MLCIISVNHSGPLPNVGWCLHRLELFQTVSNETQKKIKCKKLVKMKTIQSGTVMTWQQCKIILYQVLGIITGRDQQVSEDEQLVICELLLMLLPVVMVCPSEVWQGFLYSHLKGDATEVMVSFWICHNKWRLIADHTYFNGLCVIEVSTQVHQQLGHPGGDVIWARKNASTQPENTSMAAHQVCKHTRVAIPFKFKWHWKKPTQSLVGR